MSAPSAPGVPAPNGPGAWRKAVDVGTVVVSTVLGALVGYLANIWIMAVRSDGFNVKEGSAAAAPGNILQGSIFWMLAPAVIFGIGGYWRSVGTKRFFFEMRRVPQLVLLLGRQSGHGYRVQYLLGALVGVLASLWIGPTLGLVTSLGFVAMLPTAASSILSSFGFRLTQSLTKRLARPPAALATEGAGMMTTVVALFGSATALLLGFFVTSSTAKWVIAGVLAVVLVLMTVRPRVTPTALLLVALTAAAVGLLVAVVTAHPALADDGGWVECQGQSWWDCPGSDTVRAWGILGAALGGVGAAAGAALGGIVGSWPAGSIFDDPEVLSPGDPANDLDPSEADAWIRSALGTPEFSEWARSHGASSPLTAEEFDDFMGWRHDQGLDDPPLPEVPTGVTTAEAVEGPSEGFEGAEGWSGEPGAETGTRDAVDQILDDLFPTAEAVGAGEDVFGDEFLDDLLEGPPPEEVADAELAPQPPVEEVADAELAPQPPVEEVAEPRDTSRYRPGPTEAGAAAAGTEAGREGAEDTERVGAGEEAGARPSLEGDPRFDDSMHDVDPEARPVDPKTGEPLVDPRTGEPLPADADGKVKYGDEWVDPETAARRTALDATHLTEVAQGQRLVEEFKDLKGQLDRATDPAQRAELEAALRDKATEINSDYQAKIQMKNEGRTPDVAEFDRAIHEVYGEVDTRTTDAMTERGVKIGGRDFDPSDMKEFRNAASAGTASIDRDYGLDESRVADLEDRLSRTEPGSPEARELSRELVQARRDQQITVDYDKLIETTQRQLDAAEPGSARAQELGERLAGYESDAARFKDSHVRDLNERLERAPAGSPEAEAIRAEIRAADDFKAGRADTPVSKNRWNDIATDTYRDNYTEVTGRDPQGAFQAVTQRGNVEAYGDPNVLAGDPTNRPFDPARAEQTASVTGFKNADMEHLAGEGKISEATAVQETARGTAKDTNTKLLTSLANDPRVDPAKLQRIQDINDVLTRAGRGEITPGQVDAELRKIVPGDPDMNLAKATRIIESNLEAAVKFQPRATSGGVETAATPAEMESTTSSRLNRGFSAASDLAALDANRQALIDQGLDPTEATVVAAAQTHAGNMAQAAGVADPRMCMAAGAMLPRGVDNVLPDRAVENFVGTGYQAGRAALQSFNESMESGRLDTTALDAFAEGIAGREGADPFKGFAETAQLAGEEWARTDGGNVISDMGQILETGAGVEVANESMAQFQSEVAAGKHGPALQGLDHVARIATELGVDPQTTVGELVQDLKTIYTHGVGEGYWTDAAQHTLNVLRDTPVVGHVVKGFEELGTAAGDIVADIEQRGVVEFTRGAAQDVANIGAYVYDETTTSLSNGATYIANSASNFGAWVKSYF